MTRTFIEVPTFAKKWEALGLTDDNLAESQKILLQNPKTGPLIQGTGGLRKIRIPLKNGGKSGGGRVLYVDIERKENVPSLRAFCTILNALGYELQIVEKK